MACSFSPEALPSLASFTESLSLCLSFLARADRLSAQMLNGAIDGGGWTVAIDLCKVDALLTMLKQLDDQESAAQLMNAGNQVFIPPE